MKCVNKDCKYNEFNYTNTGVLAKSTINGCLKENYSIVNCNKAIYRDNIFNNTLPEIDYKSFNDNIFKKVLQDNIKQTEEKIKAELNTLLQKVPEGVQTIDVDICFLNVGDINDISTRMLHNVKITVLYSS